MGYEAPCTLAIDSTTSRGTALLETHALVFRGPARVSVPLKSITSAVAHDGTLKVTFGDKTAEFRIGDAAAKWAKRITHPPSRLDKLGVKTSMTVAAVGALDPEFLEELAARAGTVLRSAPSRQVAMIFFAADDRKALTRLPRLKPMLLPDGALWIIRPKGRREITEAETMAAGKRVGLVDVKVVSFSDSHTAEKFVIPVAQRKSPAKRTAGKPVTRSPRR